MTSADRLDRLARLVVEVGVGLRDGQDLAVNAHVEHAALARAIAEHAYAAGARYVDVWYFDAHARRSRLHHAPAATLPYSPPWLDERINAIGEAQGAFVRIDGTPEPRLLAGIDPGRAALDPMPVSKALRRLQREGAIAWAITAAPTPGWAEAVLGEPDVDRLWDAIAPALRLDEPDPALAFEAHVARLLARAARLDELGLDAVRLRGPGTDLEIGLLPASRWRTVAATTRWGQRHLTNLPSEEVFTTPDRRRANGVVATTLPVLVDGIEVRGLVLELRAGRIVRADAESGVEVVRGQLATDEGAAQLGELALVDQSSPIAQAGVTFLDTLFDENATTHIAYGSAYADAVEGAAALTPAQRAEAGLSISGVHTDVMVGGSLLDVDGVQRDGTVVPLLRGGSFVPALS